MSRSRAKTRRQKNSQPLADAETSEFFVEQDGPPAPDASVTTHSPLTELADPDAEPVTRVRPDAPAPHQRTWGARIGQAGYAIVPYWFVGSGIALGIGGVVQDQPLAGACGAVAGVAAGLIHQNRARYYHRQAEALRERLRAHRIEAEANATQMRETLRSLRTEVWELRFAQQISQMNAQLSAARVFEPEEKAQIATLATQPMDFSELRASRTPLSALPEVAPDAEPVLVADSDQGGEPLLDAEAGPAAEPVPAAELLPVAELVPAAEPVPEAELLPETELLPAAATSAESADAATPEGAEPPPANPADVADVADTADVADVADTADVADVAETAAADDEAAVTETAAADDGAAAAEDGAAVPAADTQPPAPAEDVAAEAESGPAPEKTGAPAVTASDAETETETGPAEVTASGDAAETEAEAEDVPAEPQGARVIDLRGPTSSGGPPKQQEGTDRRRRTAAAG